MIVQNMADTLNQRPRRILDYHSPVELFEAFLDEVYAIDNIYGLEKCSNCAKMIDGITTPHLI